MKGYGKEYIVSGLKKSGALALAAALALQSAAYAKGESGTAGPAAAAPVQEETVQEETAQETVVQETAASENAAAQEADSALPAPCGPDELILFNYGDGEARAYDAQGRYVGVVSKYMEIFSYTVVKADTLNVETLDDVQAVRAGYKGEILKAFPAGREVRDESGNNLKIKGDFFSFRDSASGVSAICYRDGRTLYETAPGRVFTDLNLYGDGVVTLEKALITDEDAENMETAGTGAQPKALRIRPDGSVQEITSASFRESLEKNRSCTEFCGGLLVWYYQEGSGRKALYFSEEALFGGGEPQLFDDLYFAWKENEGTEEVTALGRMENGILHIFDENLQEIGGLPESLGLTLQRQEGFVRGLVYPELDWAECKGFWSFGGANVVPYALTVNGYAFLDGDVMRPVPLGTGETVSSVNHSYAVISYDKDGSYHQKAILLETGEIVADSARDTIDSWMNMSLTGDCLVTWTYSPADGYCLKIFGPDGQVTYRSRTAYGIAGRDGGIFIQRGVYRGLITPDGRWIIRSTDQDM